MIDRIPPGLTDASTTSATTSEPAHGGRADRGAQRHAGALELRQQVEPADADDQHRAQLAHAARAQPGLGEVGQRVGARATQRSGDEHQQDEVAGGPADRVPEHLRAEGQQQAGDAEEGGGGEVLPADRAGVEPRPHGARGDEEVARRARDPQPPRADHQRRERDQDDRDDAGHDVGVHDGSSSGQHRPDQVGEVALVGLRAPDVEPAEHHQPRVRQHPEQQPRQRHRPDAYVAQAREEVEEQRQQPDRQRQRDQHPHRQHQLLAQQGAHEDLAQRGLGVDLPRARRPYAGRATPRRPGDPHPRWRLVAHGDLRRVSTDRSSRVWRRLTGSSMPPITTLTRPRLAAHLLDVGERDEHRAVDPHEAGRRPLLGERRRAACARGGSPRRCAAGRSRPGPRRG